MTVALASCARAGSAYIICEHSRIASISWGAGHRHGELGWRLLRRLFRQSDHRVSKPSECFRATGAPLTIHTAHTSPATALRRAGGDGS
jgi:hypothetical protein